MRLKSLFSLPLVAALVALPSSVPAQVQLNVQFGTRLGPEIGVYAYSQERQGDWRRNYNKWTPVTLYDVNGHYYRTNVRGSRAVAVYSYHDEYFLPPSDQAWSGYDKRYNYRRRPNAGPSSPERRPVVARTPATRGARRRGIAATPWTLAWGRKSACWAMPMIARVTGARTVVAGRRSWCTS
jgi:hypothetical protein